jgi:hypothetical protein
MKFIVNVLATRRDDLPLNRNDSFTVNGGKGKGNWLKLKVPTAPDERDNLVEFEGTAQADTYGVVLDMLCQVIGPRTDQEESVEILLDPSG